MARVAAGAEDLSVAQWQQQHFDHIHFRVNETDEIVVHVRHASTLPRQSTDSTGLDLWDGAQQLATFLVAHPQQVQGKIVLELAAGCGLPALVSQKLGATLVVLSDADDDVLDLQRRNVAINGGTAKVERVCFGQAIPRFEVPCVLLAADALYLSKQVEPLRATIASALYHGSAESCLFAHMPRQTWRFDAHKHPIQDSNDEVLSAFKAACRLNRDMPLCITLLHESRDPPVLIYRIALPEHGVFSALPD